MPCNDALKAAYAETCVSYHRIDDFRGKLLALIPTLSGAGIFFVLRDLGDPKNTVQPRYVIGAALFGMLVTLGLYFYELRGIQRCVRLIKVAQDLEGQSGMSVNGQFTQWPPPVGNFICEPIAAAIIYPAVLSAWAYVAALPYTSAPITATVVFLVGFFGGWIFYRHIKKPLDAKVETKGVAR